MEEEANNFESAKFLCSNREFEDSMNEAEDDQLLSVMGDKRRFKQVLINLVKNSFKFTSAGGKIMIQTSYHKRSKSLVLHVKDTGAGMTKEEIETLFTRFGKTTNKSEFLKNEGIGIGLTIVKNIVEASKG